MAKAHRQLAVCAPRAWSGGFFDALGVEAAHGGLSVAADVPAVVLGHAVWQRVFSSADVVGKTLTISGEGALLIAGVAPPGFRGLLGEQAELWVLNPERLPSRLAQDDFLKGVEAAIPNKHVFGVMGEDMSLAKLGAVLAGMNFVDDPASGRALGVTPGPTGWRSRPASKPTRTCAGKCWREPIGWSQSSPACSCSHSRPWWTRSPPNRQPAPKTSGCARRWAPRLGCSTASVLRRERAMPWSWLSPR